MQITQSLKRHLPRQEWFWLLVIITFAGLLRFYKLGEWSLWGDEVSNINDSLRVFDLNFQRRSISRILSRVVLLNWGVSEWQARLAPALIGVITLPLMYFPLRKVVGRGAALLSIVFLAVSPWHLYWSQNARFYTSTLLFYTLALFFFYFFLEEDRLRHLLAAAVFLALAAQEHLTALILIPVGALYILVLWVGPWPKPPGLHVRNLLFMLIPGLGIGLFMALPFVTNRFAMTQIFGTPNISPIWLIGGTVYYIGIPFIVAAVGGALIGWTERSRGVLLFGLSAAIPLATVALISLVQYSANRYVFVSLTSWLVLAAFAVNRLTGQIAPSYRWLASLLILILVGSALGENFLYFQYQNGNRENWRAALEWVSAQKAPGDEVLVADDRLGRFYLGDETRDLRDYSPPGKDEIEGTTWYVVDMNLPLSRPETTQWIQRHATLRATFDVNFRARLFALRVYELAPGDR